MKKLFALLLAITIFSMTASLCFSASAEATDSEPTTPVAPKADLLDLTFNEDGTWSENAAHEKFAPECGVDNTTITVGETAVYHNGKYYKANALIIDSYEEWFSIDFGKYATSSDSATKNEFLTMLADGYTLSCTFEAHYITPDVHKAIFSSTQQGGFGLYFTAGSDKSSNPDWAKESGKMFFELSHRGSNAWSNLYSLNYVQNNGDLAEEVLYDVAVSYFAEENKLVMYVNGVKTDEIEVTDELIQGNTTYKFGLGVDVAAEGMLGDASQGGLSIVNAKLYTNPITEAEAKAAYDAVIASLGTAYDTEAEVPVVTTTPAPEETTTAPADTTIAPADETTANEPEDTTTDGGDGEATTTVKPEDTTTAKTPDDTTTAEKKNGCASMAGMSWALTLSLGGLVALTVKKRKY